VFLVISVADELKFIVARYGHVVTLFNSGGNCSVCGKLYCKECLVMINDEMLCPTYFKKSLKENKNK